MTDDTTAREPWTTPEVTEISVSLDTAFTSGSHTDASATGNQKQGA